MKPVLPVPFLIHWVLIAAVAVVEGATDVYVPAIPHIVQYFHACEEAVGVTMGSFLAALCLSGPFLGPLSDAWGRRPVFLGGMTLFTLASFLCATAPSVESLIFFRFIQGLGGGCAWVLSLAIVKDVYADPESHRMVGKIFTTIALSTGLAPILGGYVAIHYGWRSIFLMTALLALSGVAWAWTGGLPETHPVHKRVPFRLKPLFGEYAKMLRHRGFMNRALIASLVFGALWTYIASAPFFFITVAGVSVEHYGYFQMVQLAFHMLGTSSGARFAASHGPERTLGTGLWISLAGAGLVLVFSLLSPTNPYTLTLGMAVYSLGIGVVFSSASSQALSFFPHRRGTASSFYSSLETLAAALGASFAGLLDKSTFFHPSLAMLTMVLIAFFFYARGDSPCLKAKETI